ncbi:heme exporter protein CcmD [uncultured Microbulbifer sp.]|uniref:heme exporter protein CcmD n=1 Tax=uncultured Microbulbifer sp. TaxID=348147 RepID=UPI0025E608EF|nr:heme exporter protein CcmD [uncultured Microbulbifer sp.]
MEFQFSSFAEFLAMNGHGPYVWVSYLVAAVVMIALAVAPLVIRRRLRREVAQELRLEEARRRAARERAEESRGAVATQ